MRYRPTFFVYIMASISGVLYIGISKSLDIRTLQHKEGNKKTAFTSQYHVTKLVYYENFQYINDAIAREKQLKGWNRQKKLTLIQTMNPTLTDLAFDWHARSASEPASYHQDTSSPRSFDSPSSTFQQLAQDDRKHMSQSQYNLSSTV